VFGYVHDHLVTGYIDQITAETPTPAPIIDDIYLNTRHTSPKLIISDVKPRVNSSLPGPRNSRAAQMQLSLYHQLLSQMLERTVNVARVFTDLGLDSDMMFSDSFLAEVAQVYVDGTLAVDEILQRNTLNVYPTHTPFFQVTYRNYGNSSRKPCQPCPAD